jgi:hypothetical protein
MRAPRVSDARAVQEEDYEKLESVVRERLVGICHSVRIFSLLDAGPGAVEGIYEFS